MESVAIASFFCAVIIGISEKHLRKINLVNTACYSEEDF